MAIKNDMEWTDLPDPRGKGEDFYKVKNGNNKARLMTKPHAYEEHWIKTKSKDKPHSEICAGAGCNLCKAGKAPTKRYASYILDRDDDETEGLKIWQYGKMVYNDLCNIASDPDYGSPLKRDIKINKTGTGKENTKYQVTPSPKESDLEEFEIEMVKNAKPMSEVFKAKSYEELLKIAEELI